ncbi:MAG: substrate-binding domain-containing protein, partial [Alphaproteobacteria bacterium]
MAALSILSGGAANGYVDAIKAAFTAEAGIDVGGIFGAVGAMRAKLEAGHPTDIVIFTSAMVADLATKGLIDPSTVTNVGRVATSVAVRADRALPPVSDGESLKAALLASDAVYFPDPATATAGIHFAAVLEKLGVLAALDGRLKTFPNGATAMAAMAKGPDANPIGCTQATEIISTPGVTLVAPLPDGFDLVTTYTAAV